MVPSLTTEERTTLEALFKKRLYTKENIAEWLECERQLNTAPFTAVVKTYDRYGELHEIPATGPRKRIHFCSYQQVVQAAENQPKADEAFDGMLVRVVDAAEPSSPKDCCEQADRKETYAAYKQEWLKSPFPARLRGYIAAKSRRTTQVTSVVCFGLGKLKDNLHEELMVGSHVVTRYLQHIAAIQIRDMVEQTQKLAPGSIPIYVQDPDYCANCKLVLEGELGLTVVPSNSGFLMVDGNTFVMTCAPTAPVRQIVGDLTVGVGGPAGMLCEPIEDDGVVSAEGYADPSSPNLYLNFAVAAATDGLKVAMRRVPDDSSDEEDDSSNAVYYEGKYVPGSIFIDIALYFKKKKAGS